METSDCLQREHSEINCRELTAIELYSHIYYRALPLLLYHFSGYPPHQDIIIIVSYLRISTKVEGESEEDELDIFSPMTTDPSEEPNVVSLLMREGVRRRGVVRQSGSASLSPPTRNIVTEEPSRELQLRNHVLTSPIETMEVVVDLNTEEGGEEHLVVLTTLTYSGNNVLTIQPDFSWSGRPYRSVVSRTSHHVI